MKNSNLFATAVLASTLLISAPSLADDHSSPSFSNWTLNYVDLNVADESLNGYGLELEAAFDDALFISADYIDASDTFTITGVDFDVSASVTHANIGYRFTNDTALVPYVSAGYSRIDGSAALGIFSSSSSESGWNAQAGLRARLTEFLEFDASVRHIDIGDGSDQAFTLKGLFYATNAVSLNLGYDRLNDDEDFISFGISLHY